MSNDCNLAVAGIKIKNARHTQNKRATKVFRVSGSLEDNDTWEPLLEEEFSDPFSTGAPTVETHLFENAVELKYVRFDIDSFFGSKGAGLDYFAVITLSGNSLLQHIKLLALTLFNRFV